MVGSKREGSSDNYSLSPTPYSLVSVVLLVSVLAVSAAAPLIRVAHADPLAVATWRVGFSLMVVAGALVVGGGWREWRGLTPRELAAGVGGGVALAFHFWAWNASLRMTTVAASVVLVNLQPIFVAGLSVVLLRERPTAKQWVGIGIAVGGAAIIAAGDAAAPRGSAGDRALLGDALALVGAFAVAFYYIAGRGLRGSLGLWAYVGLVYGSCFVALLVMCGVSRAPLAPQPPREMAIFAALALGPMLLGHTGFNWALRYLPAYVVSVSILGEPVGATLIAALLPQIHEIPTIVTLVGSVVAVVGIVQSRG